MTKEGALFGKRYAIFAIDPIVIIVSSAFCIIIISVFSQRAIMSNRSIGRRAIGDTFIRRQATRTPVRLIAGILAFRPIRSWCAIHQYAAGTSDAIIVNIFFTVFEPKHCPYFCGIGAYRKGSDHNVFTHPLLTFTGTGAIKPPNDTTAIGCRACYRYVSRDDVPVNIHSSSSGNRSPAYDSTHVCRRTDNIYIPRINAVLNKKFTVTGSTARATTIPIQIAMSDNTAESGCICAICTAVYRHVGNTPIHH